MLLRAVTPLTGLLLVAFVLMLLSVISTPLVKSIPLGSFDGVNFGAMGYCQGKTCSDIEIGYNTEPLFTSEESATFDLPSSTRTTLSAILILHPIAAAFTLILLICAASAHCRSPSHSTRYLCAVFILGIITLLLSLLAFLIDVLLFTPHLAFGAFITLAAVILIAISSVVLCAMRRTLVGRKARKKRIEGNAEMSGANFYARNESSVPMATTLASPEEKPSFTTFVKSDSEEKAPLQERSPSEPTVPMMSGANGPTPRSVEEPPRNMGHQPPVQRDHSAPPTFRSPREDPRGRGGFRGRGFGGPGYGAPPPPAFRGGFRGRGYGPPPRGRFPTRGMAPPPRGMYGPMRGGYGPPPPMPGPPGMRDGSAPPTYRSAHPDAYGPEQTYASYGERAPSAGPYPQVPSSSAPHLPPALAIAHNLQTTPSPQPHTYVPYTAPVDRVSSVPSADFPPSLPAAELDPMSQPLASGPAIEMEAGQTPRAADHAMHPMGDSDISGMVNLQQQRQGPDAPGSHVTSSHYSGDGFAPPRGYSPGNMSAPLSYRRPSSTRARTPSRPASRAPSHDNYYEDVEPRFVNAQIPASTAGSLMPPPMNGRGAYCDARGPPPPLGYDGAYDLHSHAGARSPAAETDGSDLTSISRRGVNPQWMGDAGMPMPARRPRAAASRREDLLLNSNPDFSLPPMRGMSSGPRGMLSDGPYPGPRGM